MQLRPIKTIFAYAVIFIAASISLAQDGPQTKTLGQLKESAPPATPTTAEVMRERISNAKAYIVVKNYPAAVYELENIRRETNEPTVNRVLNVLLMHAYLEQGDYQKAQKFLKELHKDPAKALDYFAVASQVISGARTQLARYNALGVSVSDTTLPEEAKDDLESMRETLEMVAAQSKEIGKRKEMAGTAVAILEESSAARGNLARDAYDEKRWTDQVAEAREQIVTPRSNIINAVKSPLAVPDQTPDVTLVAQRVADEEKPPIVEPENGSPVSKPKAVELKQVAGEQTDKSSAKTIAAEKRVAETPKSAPTETESAKILPVDRKVRVIRSAEKKPVDSSESKEEQPNVKSTDQVALEEQPGNDEKDEWVEGSPLPIGSLIGYATKRVNPIYPRQAMSMRMTGTVRVEVIVDEDGRVSKVENSSGPALLIRAATDAVRRWKFKPFVRDGQPVKATGFVSFSFNL
ncbi:MAG: TonB family protein [Acidobacteriota bacterium]|nr:TonB family protein [Acidobacteriota bacterium]MDH3529488.1 TonB family protein [Acidobacteriota bacterium]